MTIYSLTYSFPNFQPVHHSTSDSNSCFVICIQVPLEAGKVVWYSHLFKNFSQFVVIHTIKGFNIVIEAEVFLEFSCFFYDTTDVSNLISGSSTFAKSSLNIWEFFVHILLKLSLENSEYYFASMWNQRNCVAVWTFFSIALLWDWNENWPLPVLWPLLSFPDFPGKNSRVGCYFLFQGMLPTRELAPGLLHWQAESSPPSHLGDSLKYLPVRILALMKKQWRVKLQGATINCPNNHCIYFSPYTKEKPVSMNTDIGEVDNY